VQSTRGTNSNLSFVTGLNVSLFPTQSNLFETCNRATTTHNSESHTRSSVYICLRQLTLLTSLNSPHVKIYLSALCPFYKLLVLSPHQISKSDKFFFLSKPSRLPTACYKVTDCEKSILIL